MADTPLEPAVCRRNAEAALDENAPTHAAVWALLAIAGELADIRRKIAKRER